MNVLWRLCLEDHGAVELGDPAGPRDEGDPLQGIVTCLREVAGDFHVAGPG